MPTYEQLVASQQFAHNQNVTAMATGLPLGFGAGFKVTWTAPNLVKVGPGAANVDGEQVSINETTLIDDRMWLVVRNASTHFYIYLTRQGQFEVDITGPIQSVDNDFYNYHPITNARFIGRIFIDSNLDQVFATTGTKAVPQVLVGASTWTDDSDYLCDGSADEEEINTAIKYLSDAFSGGVLNLSPGTFVTAATITLQSSIVLAGAGFSSVIRKNGNYHGITATGSDGSELTGIVARDFKLTRDSSDTNSTDLMDFDYVDNSLISNVDFSSSYRDCIRIADSDDVIIENSKFLDFRVGGLLSTTCKILIRGNFFTTTVPGGDVACIDVSTGGSGTRVEQNIIRDIMNTVANGAVKGIVISGAESVVANNTIIDLSAHTDTGWGIATTSGATIQGNSIIRVETRGFITGSPLGAGIYINGNDVKVSDNHLESCTLGIDIASGNDTHLTGNTARDCGQLIDYGNCETASGPPGAPMLLGETTPSVSGATWARSSDFAYEGTYSYKHTSNAGGGRADFNDNESSTDLHGLVAGVEYTLKAWLYIPTAGGPSDPVNEIELEIGYYDSGAWTFASSSPAATYDAWQKVSVTSAFPGTATGGLMRLITSAAVSNGEIFYADNIRAYPTDYQNNHDNARDDDGTDTKEAANSWN